MMRNKKIRSRNALYAKHFEPSNRLGLVKNVGNQIDQSSVNVVRFGKNKLLITPYEEFGIGDVSCISIKKDKVINKRNTPYIVKILSKVING